ncbi:NAD(P)/FAD-dependent oxidoreductase [Limosilactobacillus sp.]|uniref:NAD(P)/FAD-dependent oxidoreductase n=1 Tax=Limosilactobacillus sp. TaxID=2773925 RepID=UPI00345EB786
MKQIVVLGAGYAGLRTVTQLQKKLKDQAHITLVNREPYHYQATMIHEVAAGNIPTSKVTFDIQPLLNPSQTTLIVDTVINVDPDARTVQLANHDDLHYDYCVLAVGFISETFGIKGAEENSLPLTNVKQAEAINQHIEEQMKAYQKDHNPNDLKIVVCGAGFTGIELVGELADARPRYAKLAGVNPEDIHIEVLDAAARLLPMFNDKLAHYGISLVKKLDVTVTTQALIQEIKPGVVLYRKAGEGDDQPLHQIQANTIIWTTGVSGSSVIAKAGLKQRRGRVMVTGHLTDPDHDDLYLIGDVAAVMPPQGKRPYPTTAQIALSMATFVAEDLTARLKQQQRPSNYVYHSQGTVASVGDTRGLGTTGSLSLKGYPASALKKIIVDKSLLELGGMKLMMKKGRFDLYH